MNFDYIGCESASVFIRFCNQYYIVVHCGTLYTKFSKLKTF